MPIFPLFAWLYIILNINYTYQFCYQNNDGMRNRIISVPTHWWKHWRSMEEPPQECECEMVQKKMWSPTNATTQRKLQNWWNWRSGKHETSQKQALWDSVASQNARKASNSLWTSLDEVTGLLVYTKNPRECISTLSPHHMFQLFLDQSSAEYLLVCIMSTPASKDMELISNRWTVKPLSPVSPKRSTD